MRREHHRRIESVLRKLDIDFLKDNQIFFGGGTAIALQHDEYRLSVDIDLMVSDKAGFRAAKELIGPGNLNRIFTEPIEFDFRVADQYAIRGQVIAENTAIKFEIVLDAYLHLTALDPGSWPLGIPTLSTESSVAEKLLANADRWADSGVFSRDILDLAIVVSAPHSKVEAFHDGLRQSIEAYGITAKTSAARAINQLLGHPARLARCLDALSIDSLTIIDIQSRLRSLLGLLDQAP